MTLSGSSRIALLVALVPSLALAGKKAPAVGEQPKIPAPPAWTPPVSEARTTASGARVLSLSRRELPLVHVDVVVRAGAELDPANRPGLAEAVATMLQEGGAGALSGPELAAAFESLGDELQIKTLRDGVVLGMTVQSRHLGKLLALVGDLLVRPRFDASEWTRVRARLQSEIVHRRDEARDIAEVVTARALYGEDHPYGRPAHGTEASIGALTVEELRAFYQQHYGPRTTSVLLVGDVTPDAGAALVDQALAGWKGQAVVPPLPPAPAASATGMRLVLVDKPGAPQSEVRVGHIGIARSSELYGASELIAMVLGGSFTSRLVQNLREKHGYTYGVSARYQGLRAPGPFLIRSGIRTDVTAPAVHEILVELAAIHAPLLPAELDKARALLRDNLVQGFMDGAATVDLVSDVVLHDLPLDAWSRQLAELATQTPARVATASHELVRDGELTVVVVGDVAKVEAPLRALAPWKTIEKRDVDGKMLN